MSHNLQAKSVKSMVGQPRIRGEGRSSPTAILQDVERASLKGSEGVCESPLCDVSFPESGLVCKPKRFCSDDCAQQASLIRRTAALFGLTVEKMVELLRGCHETG